MMDVIFTVWHDYDDSNGREHSKLIGAYTTREAAVEAQERALALPGFRDHPDVFMLGETTLGDCAWHDGFVSIVNDEDSPDVEQAAHRLASSAALPPVRHPRAAPVGYWIDEVFRGNVSFGCEVGLVGEKPFAEGLVEFVARQRAVADANSRAW